jgi:D-alanine--poly(phosphoribitol) ligase subunit 2
MGTELSLQQRIVELIRDTLLIEEPAPELDLIASGLVDSLVLVSLITEIEHEFGFDLPLDEIDLDRFRSAGQIATFVAACDPDPSA